MRKKAFVTLALTAGLILASSFNSFALFEGWVLVGTKGTEWVYLNGTGERTLNEWKQKDSLWYYLGEDGLIILNQWHRDDDGKWYYLGEDGAMLANTTTPDGYTVNAEGCWTVNGVVQIQ